MSKPYLDYIPTPEHAARKAAKRARWAADVRAREQAALLSMVPQPPPLELPPARPQYSPEALQMRIAAIRAEPTLRRMRFDANRARARSIMANSHDHKYYTQSQLAEVRLIAETDYPADLQQFDEQDKAAEIRRLTEVP